MNQISPQELLMKSSDMVIPIQPKEEAEYTHINKIQVFDLNIPKRFFYAPAPLLLN